MGFIELMVAHPFVTLVEASGSAESSCGDGDSWCQYRHSSKLPPEDRTVWYAPVEPLYRTTDAT